MNNVETFLTVDPPPAVVQALRLLLAYVPEGAAVEFDVLVYPILVGSNGQDEPIAVEKLLISRPNFGRVIRGTRRQSATSRPAPAPAPELEEPDPAAVLAADLAAASADLAAALAPPDHPEVAP